MVTKYTLKTNDTLKCSACGNKEFEQERMNKDGVDAWGYICGDCGHAMAFMSELKEKKSMF